MTMDHDGMRAYALTLAHRAVKDIRRDGFRQLRGYVDMGAILARSPGQKLFFSTAQRLLAKADSAYYPLVQRLLEEVEEGQLCTLAVNVGTEALASGVVELRRQAQAGNTPAWLVRTQLENAAQASAFHHQVLAAQKQGTRLFCADCDTSEAAQTLLRHTSFDCRESVFFLRLAPRTLDAELLRALRAAENAVPLLMVPENGTPEDCLQDAELLKKEKLCYGLFYRLPGGAKLDTEAVRRLAAVTRLCVVWAGGDKADEKALQKTISAQRKAPDAPILLIDWTSDSRAVKKYVSAGTVRLVQPEDPCK